MFMLNSISKTCRWKTIASKNIFPIYVLYEILFGCCYRNFKKYIFTILNRSIKIYEKGNHEESRVCL